MKKVLLSILACSMTIWAVAQRAKVNSAEENLKNNQLDKAKADIEAALKNDKTKGDAKTWFVKGKVYEALAVKNKNLADVDTAFEAYQKALEINPKLPEAILQMNQSMFNLYATVGNAAYQEINTQQWDSAFTNFKKTLAIAEYYNSKNLGGSIPQDTAMLFYTGYVAYQAGQKEAAIPYLKKAAELSYKAEPVLYILLAQAYQAQNDEANWIAAIQKGKEVFPEDKRFNDLELFYYTKTGKTGELLASLEKKLASNPNDFDTQLEYAIRLDNMANPKDPAGNEVPKPANYDELIKKAEEAYKKALALNANDATANFQLGALYYNQAAGVYKALNSMDSKQQTSPKGKELAARGDVLINQAFPYFEKADQAFAAKGKLDESDKGLYEGCLNALQRIYAIKNQMDKVAEVKKKLEALK